MRFKNGGLGSIVLSNSQKPGIHGKVHIHGSNGASVGVQTDGGAMFIAGMSNVLERSSTAGLRLAVAGLQPCHSSSRARRNSGLTDLQIARDECHARFSGVSPFDALNQEVGCFETKFLGIGCDGRDRGRDETIVSHIVKDTQGKIIGHTQASRLDFSKHALC
jgi:hypothetical protein